MRAGAIDALLRQLRRAFASNSDGSSAVAIALLPVLESIITEANRLERFQSSGNLGQLTDMDVDEQQEGGEQEHEPSDGDKKFFCWALLTCSFTALDDTTAERIAQVTMIVERLSSPFVRGNAKIVQSVTRVLPFLTYGQRAVIAALVKLFDGAIDPSRLDDTEAERERCELLFDCFADVLSNARDGRVGQRLRDTCRERGLTARLLAYAARVTDDDAFDRALERRSMKRALAVLAALAYAHSATQRDVMQVKGLLSALHRMESASTKGNPSRFFDFGDRFSDVLPFF